MSESNRRLSVIKRHLSSNSAIDNIQNKDTNLSSGQSVNNQFGFDTGEKGNANVAYKQDFSQDNSSHIQPVKHAFPLKRQDLLKWNGWGYNDSKFIVNKIGDRYSISFTGDRYKIGENLILPHFADWVIETLGVDFSSRDSALPQPREEDLPKPIIQDDFVEEIRRSGLLYSLSGQDRLFRSHGHLLSEIFILRESMFPRIPDIVIWPGNHSQVEMVVDMVARFAAVIIPYGGGTSVSGALLCPENEGRTIVSLDTSQMCRVLWIDEKNLTARIEAGVIGQNLEKELSSKGYTTGHEPDSYEFSSLGGWVATRASGMKKNVYGNIEDLIVQLKMVTPRGTVERYPAGPRISAGPDIHHFAMGSEGTLGVITEVTMKIRPLPEVKRYGSLVFEDFEKGVSCLREVAFLRCQPASIRLMDNEQFRFGHALKPPSTIFGLVSDGIKKIYLTTIKGFNVHKMCVATLLFEGTEGEVTNQEKRINEIARRHGGLPAGEANGERGYMLTFVIAYIRDLGFDYGVVAESFETSAPWDKVENLCYSVKYRVNKECEDRGIEHRYITCRVTQTYDAGACVYFYFAFNYRGFDDPVRIYEEVEDAARDEIIGCGGNISHHHGVGKIRRRWMDQTISSPAIGALKALKSYFDPSNTFASQNLI